MITPDPRSHWSPDDIRRVAHRVADMLADYLTTLPEGPVFTPVPIADAERFATEAPPTAGADPDAILDEFERTIAKYPFGNGHPRFWGWVNSPPAVMGILAETLAAAMNPSVAGGNHAAVHLERQVVRWFTELIGLPSGAMGLLVSGGSMANLTGLAAARHAKAGFDVRGRGLQSADRLLTVYMSSRGARLRAQSGRTPGLRWRRAAHDSGHQPHADGRRRARRCDRPRRRRRLPSGGSSGQRRHGEHRRDRRTRRHRRGAPQRDLWFHVDGAYGAAAVLSSRYRDALKGLASADSIALDPHKWLYVPVEAGLALVRDGAILRSAFSLVPPYLRTDGDPQGVGGPPWFSEFGFQQSRGFRALKVWMALRYYGTDGYARAIDHDLDLAAYLASAVDADADLELMAPASLSIVCFRYAPAGSDAAALDDLNKRLLERLQLSGRAFLSSTVVAGQFVLRACFVNPLSGQSDVDAMLQAVKEIGSGLGRKG